MEKEIFAEINSLEKEEVTELFKWICDRAYKMLEPDVKRKYLKLKGFALDRGHIKPEYVMELIKQKNLKFSLKVYTEDNERDYETRMRDRERLVHNENEGMVKGDVYRALEQQKKAILNPDLMETVLIPVGIPESVIKIKEVTVNHSEISDPDFV